MKGEPRCETCERRTESVLCHGDGDPAALAAFGAIHPRHRYLARQTLYHQGTPALGLYVLCHGRIKVSRADGRGREQIVRLVDPGGILGEEALRPDGRYVGTARALLESQAAFVGRDELLRLLREHNGMAVRLLQHLAQVLASTQAHLARLALADARSRMAGLLVELGRRYGHPADEGLRLSPAMSRGELAAMIGLTPETAMRLLAWFRDQGILRTAGRQIVLLRPGQLEALVSRPPARRRRRSSAKGGAEEAMAPRGMG